MADKDVSLRFRVTSEGVQILDDVGRKLGVIERQATATTAAATSTGGAFSALQNAAGRFVPQMTSAAAALGLATTAGAAAAGALLAVRNAINELDQINTLSLRTGQSAETLSRLAFSAELADVSIGELGVGLRFFARNLDEARQGNERARETFARLGVDFTQGLEPALQQAADAFVDVENAEARTALAIEVFGRSGQALLPVLEGGSAALREQAEEAQRLGVVMSTEAVRAADEFNDNLTRLSAAAKGLSLDLANALLPALVAVSEAMVEIAKSARESDSVLNTFLEGATINSGTMLGNLTALVAKWVEYRTAVENAGSAATKVADPTIGLLSPAQDFGATGLASLPGAVSGVGFDPLQDGPSAPAPELFQRGVEESLRRQDEQARERDKRVVESVRDRSKLMQEQAKLAEAIFDTQQKTAILEATTLADTAERRLDNAQRGLDLETATVTQREQLYALAREADAAERAQLEAERASLEATRDRVAAASDLNEELRQAQIGQLEAQIARVGSEIENMPSRVDELGRAFDAVQPKVRALGDVLSDSLDRGFEDAIRGLAQGTNDLGDVLGNAAKSAALDVLFQGYRSVGGIGGIVGGVGSIFRGGGVGTTGSGFSGLSALFGGDGGSGTSGTGSAASSAISLASSASSLFGPTVGAQGGLFNAVLGIGPGGGGLLSGAQSLLTGGAGLLGLAAPSLAGMLGLGGSLGALTAANAAVAPAITAALAGPGFAATAGAAGVGGTGAAAGAGAAAGIGGAASAGILAGIAAGVVGVLAGTEYARGTQSQRRFAQFSLSDPVAVGLGEMFGTNQEETRILSGVASAGISNMIDFVAKSIFGDNLFKGPTAEGMIGRGFSDIMGLGARVPKPFTAGGRTGGGPSSHQFTGSRDLYFPQVETPESYRDFDRSPFAAIGGLLFKDLPRNSRDDGTTAGDYALRKGPAQMLVNQAAALGLDREGLEMLGKKFTRAAVGDFDQGILNLRTEERESAAGGVNELQFDSEAKRLEWFTLGVEQLIGTFYDLPPAIDAARLAATALGEDGLLGVEALKRQIETTKQVVEGGITAAIQAAAQGGDSEAVGAALGQQVGQAFVSALIQEVLQKEAIGAALTQASIEARELAESIAAGDQEGIARNTAEFEAAFNQGLQNVRKFTDAISPALERVRDITNPGGNQSAVTFAPPRPGRIGPLPTFDTSTASVPGPLGMPRLVIAHGGEAIGGPALGQSKRVERLLEAMLRVMQQEKPINVDVHTTIDEAAIARANQRAVRLGRAMMRLPDLNAGA